MGIEIDTENISDESHQRKFL